MSNKRKIGGEAKDAYETLVCEINESEGVFYEDLYEILQDAGFSSGDAEYAVSRLLNEGYLYESEGEIFVTNPE